MDVGCNDKFPQLPKRWFFQFQTTLYHIDGNQFFHIYEMR